MNRGTQPSTIAAWHFGPLVVAALAALWPSAAYAQGRGGFGFGGGAVGGISIGADGIVRNLEPAAVESLAGERRRALANEGIAAGAADSLRKVSIARIAAAMATAGADKPLPPDVLFLGGLERVTHVFVDPDGHDVVLAGPADAVSVDASGNVVSARSGKPVLQLEDLLVALRAIDAVRAGGIKCSIDPTPEGVAKLQSLLRTQRTIGSNPDATLVAMQNALGPQRVTVDGVPGDSRFARVLVAADYRLKRIGMGLEPSGVADLPSYLSLVPAGKGGAAMPRFWLEPDYEPLSRDPDELAWRINGRRMRCLTENDLFAADGTRQTNVGADPLAAGWCERMTRHYDAVAAKQPVFAELVNCVDLAVVAALIHGRQLAGRAGLDIAPLLDARTAPLPTYDVPTSVPTVAHGIRKGSNWVVSASGGVAFQPWSFAASAAESADMDENRSLALASRPATSVWWD
jgi:hypothetical protein